MLLETLQGETMYDAPCLTESLVTRLAMALRKAKRIMLKTPALSVQASLEVTLVLAREGVPMRLDSA
jgi:hypothetical protein